MHSAGAEPAGDWQTDRPDERWVSTHCSFCGVQCCMHLRVAGGRVIGVEPRMDTHNRGKLCPKGVSAYHQIHHPDRLIRVDVVTQSTASEPLQEGDRDNERSSQGQAAQQGPLWRFFRQAQRPEVRHVA